MRLYAQTATVENGFVYLPREASWLADYLHELPTFSNSKFDDQVDSTSQALDWIKRASRTNGVWDYIDQHMVLDKHRAGHPDHAIAEQLRLPIERVQGWIAEDQKNPPQEGITALERMKATFRAVCPGCGKEILNEYIIRGRHKYYPQC